MKATISSGVMPAHLACSPGACFSGYKILCVLGMFEICRPNVAESTESGIAVVKVGAALWVGGILLSSVFGWGREKTMVKL